VPTMTRLRIPALAAATAVALGACAEPHRAAAPASDARASLVGALVPAFVQCAPTQTGSATGLVSPLLGGTVSFGGFSISLPPGAVPATTSITVTVPESPYVEVSIRANGGEHYQFLRPATVSMSYGRCLGPVAGLLDGATSLLASTPLTAIYVDEGTREPIAEMPSVDDKLLRRVIFTTDHLSGYAIASRAGTDSTGDGQ